MSFVIVDGIFARSQRRGVVPHELDPALCGVELQRSKEETRAELEVHRNEFIYRLTGVDPKSCTPMQYGGLYLELDRELLDEFRSERSVVWIDSGPGAYIDFVSDLSAQIFAYDAQVTGYPVKQLRGLRQGEICSNDPEADMTLSDLGLVFEESISA